MRRRTGETLRPAGAALGAALALLGLGLALVAPARAAAQGVRVEAAVDRTEVAVDEVLTLTVRVEAADAPEAVEFPPGELPFEVVSRSESRQASFSLGGGAGMAMRQVVTYTLGLAPRRPGRMVVPPVTARVRGKPHSSAPIQVDVLSAGSRTGPQQQQQQQPPPPPPRRGGIRGWERDLVLQVELDRREVFVGQQVTAAIWLLSPLGVVAYEGYKPPLFDGFWSEELESPRTLVFKNRSVNGIPTRAYLIQKLALFPTRAGELDLGAFQVDVAVRTGSDSPFDPFPDVRRVRRTSAPARVRVKPLPAGAPPGFASVNVGRYALEATVVEPAAVAGQPLTVRVTATGEGNVRVLALPRLPEIASARRFEPTTSERVAPRGERFGGSRTLETVLVPERTGELVVPALAWAAFDPREGKYVRLETAELRVTVGPGGSEGAAAAGANALASGLRPIRTDGVAVPAPPPWRRAPFLGLLAAPALGYAALALVLRARGAARTRAGGGPRRAREIAPEARGRLRAARHRLSKGDREGFLGEVTRALQGYSEGRLGRPVAALTREDLGAALAAAGAHPPAVKLLCTALDTCDAARYGRGVAEGEELVELAERAIAALEEADWSPAEPERAGAGR